MSHHPLAVMIAPALAFNLITWEAAADDIPYCDEMRGRAGLCVARDPIETYLVVSYIERVQGRGREIYAAFHDMPRSRCLRMLELKVSRCYRIGMYTSSEERLVWSSYGDHRSGGMTNREIFNDVKSPVLDEASGVRIQLYMATIDGTLAVIPYPGAGQCFEEAGNTADCATFWIEPFTAD